MSGAGGEITAEARELSHRDPGGTTEAGKSSVEHFFMEHTATDPDTSFGF